MRWGRGRGATAREFLLPSPRASGSRTHRITRDSVHARDDDAEAPHTVHAALPNDATLRTLATWLEESRYLAVVDVGSVWQIYADVDARNNGGGYLLGAVSQPVDAPPEYRWIHHPDASLGDLCATARIHLTREPADLWDDYRARCCPP
jgi:hypothetical protein